MISQKKNTCDKMLNYALWVDRVTTKNAIGTSPVRLVYGVDAIFPVQLSFPVVKLLQDLREEPNAVSRRMF